jgi:hypothetical protein
LATVTHNYSEVSITITSMLHSITSEANQNTVVRYTPGNTVVQPDHYIIPTDYTPCLQEFLGASPALAHLLPSPTALVL